MVSHRLTASASLLVILTQAVPHAQSREIDPRDAAVRAAIAQWSQSTTIAAYDLSISSLDEHPHRGLPTDTMTHAPLTEYFSAKGTLEVLRDDVLFFRFPTKEAPPEQSPREGPHGTLTVPDQPGADPMEEMNRKAYALLFAIGKVESSSVLSFFKSGPRIALKTRYLRGVEPEWCGLTVDQIIGTVRDRTGRATDVSSSLLVHTILDGVGKPSAKGEPLDRAIGLLDPRRLISVKILDAMRLTHSGPSAADGSVHKANIPLDAKMSSGVSHLARLLEPNQKLPAERVEGQLEVTLDKTLAILRLQVQIDIYSAPNEAKPRELEHDQELFVLVPRSIDDIHDLPREVAELLAVDTGR